MSEKQCAQCWYFWPRHHLSKAGLIMAMDHVCGCTLVDAASKRYLLSVDYSSCTCFVEKKGLRPAGKAMEVSHV